MQGGDPKGWRQFEEECSNVIVFINLFGCLLIGLGIRRTVVQWCSITPKESLFHFPGAD